MPQTGTELLSYRGDPRLGAGANGDIPVYNPKNNLDTINQTSRDVLLLNHDNNIKLYDQKIKDRDTTLQMLAQGEISSGDIDAKDRPFYERAKENTKLAFFKMIENGGVNNPQAVKEYQDRVRELNDVSIQAQSRQLELKKLEQERANQTLPSDISAYDNHIKSEQGKGFWEQINPFQKAFSLNLPSMRSSILGQPVTEGEIGLGADGLPTATTQWNTVTDKNGVVTNKQTTKTAPLKTAQLTTKLPKGITAGTQVNPDGSISPITYTPDKYWDYDTMLKNAQEQYVSDPTQRENQVQWLNQVSNYDDFGKKKLLDAYNERIAEYSRERGIQPDGTNESGVPHYPDQINYAKNDMGKLAILENPSSFAAKHALASIEGSYVEKGQALFNDKIDDYNLKKQKMAQDLAMDKAKLRLDWAKYGLEKDKINNAKADDMGGASVVLNEAADIINNGTPVTVAHPNGVNETLLRVSDPNLLQTFGKVQQDGKVTNIPDALNYNQKTNQITLLYFDRNKNATGGQNYKEEIPLDQRTWVKQITKRSFPNKDIGKINSLLDEAITNNDNSLYNLSQKIKGNQPSEKVNIKKYKVGNTTITDEQIKKGASKYNMSEDEYKKSIGITE